MIYAENILICIGIPLLISLFFTKGGARGFIASFVTGMGTCLAAAYISGFLSFALLMEEEETSIFISPVVEESMKLFPLLFVWLILEASDSGIMTAALGIGAGFATFENCCHLIGTGAESLMYVLVRGFAVGIMHVMSILALALVIIMLKRYRAAYFPVVIGALSISVSFHALYNLLVSVPGIPADIGYVLPVSAALMLGIARKRIRS